MRRNITWLVIATTSAVVASFVVPLCLLVRTLAQDRAQAAANQEARNVAILVAGLHDSPQLPSLVANLDQRGSPSTQVILANDLVLNGPTTLTQDPEVARARAIQGFTVSDAAGYRVLLPVVVEGGTAVVRTAVTPDQLRSGVDEAWAGILGVGLALLALAVLVASWLGRRVSAPVREVAEVAHRLRGGDLGARSVPSGPAETQELGRALNGLAERTTELLAAERAVVGDLSHRLRTPVTALRLDAEAVPDAELAGRLEEHILVLQRTIDEVVKDARRPVASELSARCDAAAVVAERVEFWSALAEDQGRPVTVTVAPGPVPVALSPADLVDVVDVLVDNVFAHTGDAVPFTVSFTVSFAVAGSRAVLTVTDAGPGSGVPPGSRVGSTGWGLDLVRRTVAAAGGILSAGPRDGGWVAEVALPVREDA